MGSTKTSTIRLIRSMALVAICDTSGLSIPIVILLLAALIIRDEFC